ncbi:hypothetical protein QYM36_007482 [Artemia franciscana]|uniref:Uncharacterized protein n=1 Tax=Artemia franciscana TaxID=6661 RepID=A0AA88IMT6_ARTSF|nr:hypothetical protein QYM36_007482 [Artemia franciscana]
MEQQKKKSCGEICRINRKGLTEKNPDYLAKEQNKYLTKEAVSGIDCEFIWTDGPFLEFRNKFMAQFLKKLSDEHNVPFCWKYFATSHGKGVVNRIGSNPKSPVRRSVMSKGSNAKVVQSSNDFARAASRLMNKTTVSHISQEQIDQHRDSIDFWRDMAKIDNTISMDTPKSVEVNDSLAIGEWCVIKYDDEEFPGEVISKIRDEYEVSVLHRAGKKNFKWPSPAEKLLYNGDEVTKKLEGLPDTPEAWNISPELLANVSQCSLKTATHVAGKIIALKCQFDFIDTKLPHNLQNLFEKINSFLRLRINDDE